MKKALYSGFIIIIIGIAVWLLPGFMPTRGKYSRNACIANLEYIQKKKLDWASRFQKAQDAEPTLQDLFGEKSDVMMPTCPAGGNYHLGKVGEPPTCSIGGVSHSLVLKQ